jgi:Arylsulfatase A and related enzymes
MKRLLVFCFAALAAHAETPPNFLLLITDDQRWDALGVVQEEQGERARFPWFETPNLDRLAREGVRFRNAFVTDPLCAPSRASILTGRHPHAAGVTDNFTPFSPATPTFASALRKAGYVTSYIGKWHMGTQAERPGFDETASYIGFGRYFGAEFLVNGRKEIRDEWIDDAATDYAITFIKKNRERPFALVVGFKAPHDPQTPAERHRHLFDGAEARTAVSENVPTPYRNLFRLPVMVGTPEKFLNYFRCLVGVDENVGRLLDTLDELKLAENTVVIFMSDNGYYLGERHLLDKRTAYEESLRIPLLIRAPSLFGGSRVEDRVALNIDLAPTILDLAGLSVPESVQGRSLRPLLENRPPETWRDGFFFRYYYDRTYPYAPGVAGVRTSQGKLIRYPGREDWTEVFDLRADPYELNNLARDPHATDLRDKLEAEFVRLGTEAGIDLSSLNDPAETGRATSGEMVFDLDLSREDGAGRFDGKTFREVANAPQLDPSNGPWTVEALIRPTAPDGVIVARGGKFQGYALSVERGCPVFSVRSEGKLVRVAGPSSITDRWTHLAGILTDSGELRLYIDGQRVASVAGQFITATPNEPMQIAADEGTAVAASQPRFTGEIARIRLFNGARDEAALRNDALKSNHP